MPSSGVQTCALDRKSTRLNSSHGSISVAVSLDRKSTRLNSSHGSISYAVFCLKKKKHNNQLHPPPHSLGTVQPLTHTSVAPSTVRACVRASARCTSVLVVWMFVFFF